MRWGSRLFTFSFLRFENFPRSVGYISRVARTTGAMGSIWLVAWEFGEISLIGDINDLVGDFRVTGVQGVVKDLVWASADLFQSISRNFL